jgi:hypothetical protein
MDDGVTKIEDANEGAAAQRQARRVHLHSAITAVLLTALALLV